MHGLFHIPDILFQCRILLAGIPGRMVKKTGRARSPVVRCLNVTGPF
jgi:hypothetical protein